LNEIIPIRYFSFASTSLKAQNQKDFDTLDSKNTWEKIAPYFSPPHEYKNQYGNYRSSLKFYDGHIVKTKKDWIKRRKEILATWNKMMGEWPTLLTSQKMKMIDSVRRDGFMQYTIQFY